MSGDIFDMAGEMLGKEFGPKIYQFLGKHTLRVKELTVGVGEQKGLPFCAAKCEVVETDNDALAQLGEITASTAQTRTEKWAREQYARRLGSMLNACFGGEIEISSALKKVINDDPTCAEGNLITVHVFPKFNREGEPVITKKGQHMNDYRFEAAS